MEIKRRKTREITIGSLIIGGNAPVSVQSMIKEHSDDLDAVLLQARRLEKAGCELIRISVPNDKSLDVLARLIKAVKVPVVADIHFDYRLALRAMELGSHGVRINPGNIGGKERVLEVLKAAMERGTCIRIGVNVGSLEKRYRHMRAVDAMVESALYWDSFFLDADFYNFKISAKASDVRETVEAYRKISLATETPLHLGVTEAGTRFTGAVRSAVALGVLLSEGIGDTIRVSLSSDPVWEVIAGYEILRSLGLREPGPQVIACPTCARAEFNVMDMAEEIEERLYSEGINLKVAVMGCVVNGPGEAVRSDIGIVGSGGKIVFFVKGKKTTTSTYADWRKVFDDLLTFLTSRDLENHSQQE